MNDAGGAVKSAASCADGPCRRPSSAANLLSGPTLSIADPTRAEAYAGAAGLRVDRVLAIRDGGQSSIIEVTGDRAMSAPVEVSAPPPPPPFSPGLNRGDASVTVDYALTR